MDPDKRRRRGKAKARENKIERGNRLKHLKRFLRGGYELTPEGTRLLESCK